VATGWLGEGKWWEGRRGGTTFVLDIAIARSSSRS
jgi:hypothetical protein